MEGSLLKISCDAIHHCSVDAVCFPNVRFRTWIKIIRYGDKILNTELLKSLIGSGTTGLISVLRAVVELEKLLECTGC